MTEAMTGAMPPEYARTLFELDGPLRTLPSSFAIITAVMPRGFASDASTDAADDAELEKRLRGGAYEPRRIIGWAPTAQAIHAEKGWLVPCSKAEAARLGRDFRQDAVWWVEGDALSVVPCLGRYDKTAVRPGFRARVCHREPKGRPSAGGVVVHPDGGRVLLRRPTPNPGFDGLAWTFAKGGLDGESLAVAARREVREELGVDAELCCPIHGWFLGRYPSHHYFVMH